MKMDKCIDTVERERERERELHFRKIKKEKGITLIALVITIIVLLILVGITIHSLTGSGLLEKAKLAKEKNLNATIKENITIAINCIQTEFMEKGKKFSRDDLTQELFQKQDNNIYNYGAINKYAGIYKIDNQNIQFKINEDLSVSIGDEDNSSIIGDIESQTDNIQKWIQCANLQNQYKYNTMDEVLKDKTCIQQLINSKNAVDYMVRSNSVIMPAILNNIDSMKMLSENDYAGYKAIINEKSRVAIYENENVQYFDNNSKTPQNIGKGSIVYSSYQYETGKAQNAFDGDKSTQWWTNTPNGAYIGYDFEEPINIYKIILKKGPDVNTWDYYVKTGHIQYSDDGTNWTNVNDTEFETTAGDINSSFIVNDAGEHQYWRITCESSRWVYWDQVSVGELEMYGRNYITDDEWYNWAKLANVDGKNFNTLDDMINDNNTIQKLMQTNEAVDYMINNQRIRNSIKRSEKAINALVNSNYALRKAITNDIWLKMIIESTYSDKLDENSKTPQNIGKGSIVYSSYQYDFYNKPENAFDGDKSTQWWTNVPNGAYIGYDFEEPINIYKIKLKKGPDVNTWDYYVKTGHIQYSDDGTNWTNVKDTAFETTAGDTVSSFIVNAGAHRYWRITCESSRWVYWDQVSVGELEMYGKIF